MARVVYVEPEEEITDLVARIRDSGEGPLVFVFPNRTRVLVSPLNLRLLQQYSRSFAVDTSVVSGDVRIQSMAHEIGLPVFASVAAYERGVRAPVAADALDVAGAPGRPGAVGLPQGAAAHVWDQPDESVADPWRSVAPVGAVAGRAAGPRRSSRRGLYAAVAIILAIGVLLLVLVAPSAKVTVVLNAQPVAVKGGIIQGTPDLARAADPDKVPTSVESVDEPGSFQAKPTGTKQIPAAAATAQIQFQNAFSTPFCVSVQKNVVLAASSSVVWQVSTPPPNTCPGGATGVLIPASTNGQPGPPSELIPVVAMATGAAGNVGAGQINKVDPHANGCNADNYPDPTQAPRCSPNDITVTNPAGATGGVDAKTLTIVSPDDQASFQSQVNTIVQQGEAKARSDMLGRHPGGAFAVDPGGNGLALSHDISPALPATGATFQAATITVTVHGKGVVYLPAAVKQRMNDRLQQEVQNKYGTGAQLSDSGKVISDPRVQQSGDDGVAVFDIDGSGYSTPPVDLGALKDSFTGKGKSTVRDLVVTQYGNALQDVQITQSIPVPWLPFLGSRVEVSVCVRSPDTAC